MHPGARSMRGRKIWSCAPCTILLLSVFDMSPGAEAMFQGSGRRDTVHRVFKVKVTEDVRVLTGADGVQLKERRDGDLCPTSYSLCAASLGGDCCPENYACAEGSCYATTAAASSCQGTTGQYACPFSLQGGCCPQGLVCATDGCAPPAGATYTTTCPTGYFLCPASMNYGCCSNGMGCAASYCYNTSPSTTTITYTTSADGSAMTVTTTSVTTPALQTGDVSSAGNGPIPKFFPTTEAKVKATSAAGSSGGGGGGGLSKGAIGGIVAAIAALVIAVLAATFFILKRLRHTEQAVQSHRETTSGTRTRRTAEKKSEVNVRVQPTPSEVDNMDYDPLMMNSSVASPRRQHHLSSRRPGDGRSRSGSDDAASQPSVWSGPSAGMRWNTPSVTSDPDDNNPRFELPPRPHGHQQQRQEELGRGGGGGGGGGGARVVPLRHSANSADSTSQFSYHNFAYAQRAHGRHESNASELSAGSADEIGGGGGGVGVGAPLIRPGPGWAAELDAGGAATPELPGSDTETESNHNKGGGGGRGGGWGSQSRRRQSANPSINNIVSPMSSTTASRGPRRRGDSNGVVSPVEHAQGQGQGQQYGAGGSQLGSIDESVAATDSLHGHYGPPVGMREVEGNLSLGHSPTVPGFVSLGPGPGPGSQGWGGEMSSQDDSDRSR